MIKETPWWNDNGRKMLANGQTNVGSEPEPTVMGIEWSATEGWLFESYVLQLPDVRAARVYNTCLSAEDICKISEEMAEEME